eukprot:6774202-Alexandrium_andersonii.AAC.1
MGDRRTLGGSGRNNFAAGEEATGCLPAISPRLREICQRIVAETPRRPLSPRTVRALAGRPSPSPERQAAPTPRA